MCFQQGFKVTKTQTVYEKFGFTEYFNTVMFYEGQGLLTYNKSSTKKNSYNEREEQ